MGLGDLRAKLLLFFARKLREWANSIDQNAQSQPAQPPSVVVERHGSEPLYGPPQHWVDLVSERAPELLSLTPEYFPNEVPLREDHPHVRRADIDDEVEIPHQKYRADIDDEVEIPRQKHRADIDDEVEIPRQKPVNVPTGKEDVARKSGPVAVPPPRVKRSARKLTTVKSFLPRPKPLTLKPLTEPSPRLQPPAQARDQVTEPVKPAQIIEVFGSDKKTLTPPDRFRLGAVDKKNRIAARESGVAARESGVVARESDRQPSQQAPRSETASVNYATTKRTTPIVPAAQAPDELVTRKSEAQRPAFNVVRKPQSAPRRYLQAIVSVTRKTLRRTAKGEVKPARAITAINLVNPSSKHSSTPGVVRLVETPKPRPPVRRQASSTPVVQRSEREAEPLVYQRSRARETARPQASPLTGLRPKTPIENAKTASRLSSTVAFPRAVNRVANTPSALIQDAFVNMPALMDEEKMNSASSVHFASLHPGKNQWPDLPPAASTDMADELAAHERDIERMRRLKQEQRGTPWNE